jgi:hypothetical protein
MPAPMARNRGRNIAAPPAITPGTVTAAAATHIAITSPDAPGSRCPAALLPMM